MAERVLTQRELNRATLARQFLLEQTNQSPLDVIKHLVALQGQVSNAPYIGLWTRLHGFQRADLTDLIESRQVVRASSLIVVGTCMISRCRRSIVPKFVIDRPTRGMKTSELRREEPLCRASGGSPTTRRTSSVFTYSGSCPLEEIARRIFRVDQ